jgi:hypothetical protein
MRRYSTFGTYCCLGQKMNREVVLLIAITLLGPLSAMAGTPQVSGTARLGELGDCAAQGRRAMAEASPVSGEPKTVVMDKHRSNASQKALLQEYLSYHLQAQEGSDTRIPLMPWAGLRIRAN